MSDVAAIAASVGEPLDDQSGHFVLVALDCNGQPAEDVKVSADTVSLNTKAFYLDSIESPDPSRTSTTKSGIAGYLNLPKGDVTVTISSALMRDVRIASPSVLLRSSTVTHALLSPAL
jgi:hypothetical protein